MLPVLIGGALAVGVIFHPALGWSKGRPRVIWLKRVAWKTYMDRRAADAFLRMQADAKAQGVMLYPGSAYRPYTQQAKMWTLARARAIKQAAKELRLPRAGETIPQTAPPGWSNHQLGTAIDLADKPGGQTITFQSPQYHWLRANAARYGFDQEVASEPWHWRWRREAERPY